MTHKKEIERWAGCPDGTKVWYKTCGDNSWYMAANPTWVAQTTYIVDDEYAQIRKAYVDGKQIQLKCSDGDTWLDITSNHEDNLYEFGKSAGLENYRIKPDKKIVPKWQFICIGSTGDYKITKNRYASTKDAIDARLKNSGWKVVCAYEPSMKLMEE